VLLQYGAGRLIAFSGMERESPMILFYDTAYAKDNRPGQILAENFTFTLVMRPTPIL
jgi:hypothetical protein